MGLRNSVGVQPRTLLTANDIRAAGFRPEAGSETVDEQVAHVWYPSARRGDRWDIGLGLYAAAHVEDADRYWDGLMDELGGGDVAPERVAVGERAVHADGWLYVRQRGQVFWIAVEGPDPVLARWAVERLARTICPRIPALPSDPSPASLSSHSAAGAPAAIADPAEPAARPAAPAVAAQAGDPSVAAEALEPPATGDPSGGAFGSSAPGEASVEHRLPSGGGGGADVGEGDRKTGRTRGLRPRATVSGRYPRRHLANAALDVDGDELVVTDARGRERRLALDGTPEAPAAIGMTIDPRHTLAAPVAYLAVVDGAGRLLVRDGELGVWSLDDLRRFAAEAGLRYLEPEMRTHEIDRHRQPIELEGTPWAFILLSLAAVVAAVVLAVVGAPAVAFVGGAAAIAALGFAASRAGQVRITLPEGGNADPPPSVIWTESKEGSNV